MGDRDNKNDKHENDQIEAREQIMVAETTFDATQDTLENLLREIGQGKIQLPDFQRGWVWDDVHCDNPDFLGRSLAR